MKVILIAKVKNFGDVGNIVKVKDGFARNFLIPRKLAICYNDANYKIFAEQKYQFEEENIKNKNGAAKIKDEISNKDIVIIGNASDDGRLYGSVNGNIIAGKINEILNKKLVSRTNISLKKPIKEIGVYNVTVNLYADISVELRLIIARSESEIEQAISGNIVRAAEEKTEEVVAA